MITSIDDYFAFGCGRCPRFATTDCSTRTWADGLVLLQQICLGTGLSEHVKWGHPCYMHAGRNIAIIGAFRADFRLSFFDAALLTDPKNVLVKQGPHSRYADAICFTSAQDVEDLSSSIVSYLREAMNNAEQGLRPPRLNQELVLPEELSQVLLADPILGAAFEALTLGRQRSYVIALESTKNSTTRFNRIEKLREKIMSGKGANER